MATQAQALDYLDGGWRSGPHTQVISAAGGLGVNQDGLYGFQCKDFANTLGEVLAAPLPAGNAIVLAQKLAPGWSWVTDPQPGDLAVRDYWAYDANHVWTNFGDVVGVTAVNGKTLSTVGQNQVSVSLTVGHVPTTATHNRDQFIKFLRRNYEEQDMSKEKPYNDGDAINLAGLINYPVDAMKAKADWNDAVYSSVVPEFEKLKQQVVELQKTNCTPDERAYLDAMYKLTKG